LQPGRRRPPAAEMMQLASTLCYSWGVGSWIHLGHTAVGSLPEGPDQPRSHRDVRVPPLRPPGRKTTEDDYLWTENPANNAAEIETEPSSARTCSAAITRKPARLNSSEARRRDPARGLVTW